MLLCLLKYNILWLQQIHVEIKIKYFFLGLNNIASRESLQVNWVINNPDQDSHLFRSIAKLADYENRTCKECDKLFATKKNRDKHVAKFHKRSSLIPENVANDENDQNRESNLENHQPQAPMDEFHETINQTKEQSVYLPLKKTYLLCISFVLCFILCRKLGGFNNKWRGAKQKDATWPNFIAWFRCELWFKLGSWL